MPGTSDGSKSILKAGKPMVASLFSFTEGPMNNKIENSKVKTKTTLLEIKAGELFATAYDFTEDSDVYMKAWAKHSTIDPLTTNEYFVVDIGTGQIITMVEDTQVVRLEAKELIVRRIK